MKRRKDEKKEKCKEGKMNSRKMKNQFNKRITKEENLQIDQKNVIYQ